MTSGGAPSLVFSDGRTQSRHLREIVKSGAFALDPMALARYATWSLSTDLSATPYEGVRCRLEEPARGVEMERAPPKTPAEGARALRSALERAVETSFGSAHRIAVMTGGGLDSAALLALAVDVARRTGRSAFGVALDFEAPGDDRPHLRALEAHLECEVVRIAPEDAAPRLLELLCGVDAAPFYCPTGALEVAMMSRAKEHGAERVLMGVGGDQIFDGRPSSLSAFAREGKVVEAVRLARGLRGFDRPRAPLFTWVARPLLANLLPRSLRARRARRRTTGLPSWAGPAIRAFERVENERHAHDLASLLPDVDRFEAKVLEAQRVQVAWLRHQEETASGIERHDPYQDGDLIGSVRRLPKHWLLHGGMRRGLFREAMHDLLPESLRTRLDKAAFEPALERLVRAAGGLATFREFSRARALASLGIVEPRAFQQAFETFAKAPQDDTASWTTIWCALAIEAFMVAA